jgi:hypothetical protein
MLAIQLRKFACTLSHLPSSCLLTSSRYNKTWITPLFNDFNWTSIMPQILPGAGYNLTLSAICPPNRTPRFLWSGVWRWFVLVADFPLTKPFNFTGIFAEQSDDCYSTAECPLGFAMTSCCTVEPFSNPYAVLLFVVSRWMCLTEGSFLNRLQIKTEWVLSFEIIPILGPR